MTPIISSGPGGTFPNNPITTPVSVTSTSDLSGPAGQIVVSQYNMTPGTTYSSLTPRNPPVFTMPAGKYCWVEDQPYWRKVTGTIDNYETQGYVAMLNFSLNLPYRQQSPLLDYVENIVISDSQPLF